MIPRTAQGMGLLIFVVVLLVAGVSVWIASRADEFTPADPSARFVESKDVPLRLGVWIAEEAIQESQAFWIEYELQNKDKVVARDARLEPLLNSTWTISLWQEQSGGNWTDLPEGTTPQTTLAPGDTHRFRARSLISGGPAHQSLATAYSYTPNANEQKRFHEVVALSPVLVTSKWRSILAGVKGLTADLLLPLVLGVLAWFLPWADAKSREAKEKQAAELAEKTAQANQTWTELLPHTIQINTKYYMPACSSILNLQWEHDHPMPGGDLRPVLHGVLMLLRHMRDCRDEIGGLHFKDRAGERVASYWWGAIRTVWDATIPLPLHSSVMDHLSSRESYNQFVAHFDDWRTKTDFLAMESTFREWCNRPAAVNDIRAFGDYIGLFEIFRAVVQFEANRPLEHWYQKKERFVDVSNAFDKLKGKSWTEIPGWDKYISVTQTYVTETAKAYPPE